VAGDVAGPFQFTHTAAHQAWYAVANALLAPFWKFRADYRVIPRVTYTGPEVAQVGLTAEEAENDGVAHEVTRFDLAGLDRAITEGEAHGFVKVLTRPGSDRILGATIVAAHAGELLAPIALAMRHGLGLRKVLATVHAYPTHAEALRATAGAWQRAHPPARLLATARRYFRLLRH
jgi:pyruvate/2-oxoglutarate dehydrogenase complex dihydrolipoamide dehydrogenase (E3) component